MRYTTFSNCHSYSGYIIGIIQKNKILNEINKLTGMKYNMFEIFNSTFYGMEIFIQ